MDSRLQNSKLHGYTFVTLNAKTKFFVRHTILLIAVVTLTVSTNQNIKINRLSAHCTCMTIVPYYWIIAHILNKQPRMESFSIKANQF
jgi:hypothetical protein